MKITINSGTKTRVTVREKDKNVIDKHEKNIKKTEKNLNGTRLRYVFFQAKLNEVNKK